jgi:hypothetical protein
VHSLDACRNGIITVSDRLEALAFPRNESVEVGADVIVHRTAASDSFEVCVTNTSVLVVMLYQTCLPVSFAIHDKVLCIASGASIGIAESVDD